MRRQLAASFALAAALGTAAAFAEPTVALRVEAQQISVNEPIAIEIVVANYQSCDPPVFPELPGCVVRSTGRGQQFSLDFNGTRSESVTYSYQLIATTVGRVTIPAIGVNVDGRTLKTNPVTLTVRPSDAEELLIVEILCEAPRIYVGQRVTLKMNIWVKPPELQRWKPTMYDLREQFAREGFGPFAWPEQCTERTRTRPDGTTAKYYVYETSAEYVPNEAGPLNVPGVGISVEYPTRYGRSLMGDPVPVRSRVLFARPTILGATVLPLPAEDRPANFSGAVGRFDIKTSATPTTVRVGDPIDLTIELRGDGQLETLLPPVLTANAALTAAFRVPTEALAGETGKGRRRFTQTIRAARADVREIPPIEYTFFDPTIGEYRVARSQAIPISVEASEKVDAGTLTGMTPIADTVRPADLGPLDGLRGNETDTALLLGNPSHPTLAHVAMVTIAPPTLFFVGWAFQTIARRRGSDPGRRRRQLAFASALRRLREAAARSPREQGAEIAATLAAYLADRMNEPAARFVGRGAATFLRERGVSESACEHWAQVIMRAEAASFGGGSDGDGDSLLADARTCVDLAERARL